jgi:hypothetical protein
MARMRSRVLASSSFRAERAWRALSMLAPACSIADTHSSHTGRMA